MKRKHGPAQQRDLFMPQNGQLDLADASAEQRALVRKPIGKLSAAERTVTMLDASGILLMASNDTRIK
jgi:hypothetical protein